MLPVKSNLNSVEQRTYLWFCSQINVKIDCNRTEFAILCCCKSGWEGPQIPCEQNISVKTHQHRVCGSRCSVDWQRAWHCLEWFPFILSDVVAVVSIKNANHLHKLPQIFHSLQKTIAMPSFGLVQSCRRDLASSQFSYYFPLRFPRQSQPSFHSHELL